jgi:hypothetical protein
MLKSQKGVYIVVSIRESFKFFNPQEGTMIGSFASITSMVVNNKGSA